VSYLFLNFPWIGYLLKMSIKYNLLIYMNNLYKINLVLVKLSVFTLIEIRAMFI